VVAPAIARILTELIPVDRGAKPRLLAVGSPQTTPAYFSSAGYPDAAGSGIVFDARIQQLTATLGSVITSTCLVDLSTCTPEQIDLILSTTSAHSFNFILKQVGSGQHVAQG